MTRMYALVVTSLLALEATGFAPRVAFKRLAVTCSATDATQAPLDPIDVDIERARECADHFGMCSVEELEKLKSGLHKERVQNFVMDSVEIPHDVDAEEVFEHRLLEEDLSVQLAMLKEEMPAERLFPEQHADAMLGVPEHKEKEEKAPSLSLLNQGTEMLLTEESESVEEALMLCAAVAMVALLPAVLHL